MSKKITDDDLDILGQLEVDVTPVKKAKLSAVEQRVIAGFEEIQRFVQEHGRSPQHGEGKDIFERLYAVRLDRLREAKEYHELLAPYDTDGFLGEQSEVDHRTEGLRDDELLATLGVDTSAEEDITLLKHVRTSAEKRVAEEIAHRERCEDFDKFKPLFEEARTDIETGARSIIKCVQKTDIKVGDFFIFQGQTAYIAEADELFTDGEGRQDCRLRIIFDNGAESAMLRRSLQKRLWEDDAARRIVDNENLGALFFSEEESEASKGSLFEDSEEYGDVASGFIYVLRSHSDEPFIQEHREIVHKIGLTKGTVERRIAGAKKEQTYLFADVEVVLSYKVSNVTLRKLESLLHRFFSKARLDIGYKDRFNRDVEPKEWFLVPLPAIKESIKKLMDGTIGEYQYDTENAEVVKR